MPFTHPVLQSALSRTVEPGKKLESWSMETLYVVRRRFSIVVRSFATVPRRGDPCLRVRASMFIAVFA